MLYDPQREAQIDFELKCNKEPWRRRLDEAADLLERVGWCTYNLINVDLNRCAMGALHGAFLEPEIIGHPYRYGDGEDYLAATAALRHYLRQKGELREFQSVATWNDRQTDGRVVIATIRAAARA